MKPSISLLVFTGLFSGFMSSAGAAVSGRFSASGGSLAPPVTESAESLSGLECVVVFGDLQQAKVCFLTDEPSAWTWYGFSGDGTRQSLPASSQTITLEGLELSIDEEGGYLVKKGETEYALYAIDYTRHPCRYGALEPQYDTDDLCDNLQVVVEGCPEDLAYFGPNGRRFQLKRRHVVTYTDEEWDEGEKDYRSLDRERELKGYVSAFVVPSPLANTRFTIQGDQWCEAFGLPIEEASVDFTAVKVCTHATAEATETEKAPNELSSTGAGLTGSAPFEVAFFSRVNRATDYCIWYIYSTPDGSGSYLYRNERDITYTFNTAGTFLVRLKASNAVCADSAEFQVTVTESSLDCPNFFTPRSSPGENDEFRVVFRSLVEFHGRILNRWGNLIFQWDDPSQGWDGTYHGRPVSPGVYYYVITATGSDGIKYVKKGDINLLE